MMRVAEMHLLSMKPRPAVPFFFVAIDYLTGTPSHLRTYIIRTRT